MKTVGFVLQYTSKVPAGPNAPARYPIIFLPPVTAGAFHETRTDLERATTLTASGALNLLVAVELEDGLPLGIGLADVPATTLYRGVEG